jgi:hypothetical protein
MSGRPLARAAGEGAGEFAARTFDYVFRHKIVKLLEKEEMWAKRSPPEALPSFAELVPEAGAYTRPLFGST